MPVLTASGTILRRGYTTGTTAAAACKAAILSLSHDVSRVTVRLPCDLVAAGIPVEAHAGHASCRKYAGDYPADVTAGIEFLAEAAATPEGLTLVPGPGIGHFSRDTPRYRKGAPAISEAPLACILAAMQEALDVTGLSGVTVTLSIPEGARVAQNTLNPRVGVTGGISGTRVLPGLLSPGTTISVNRSGHGSPAQRTSSLRPAGSGSGIHACSFLTGRSCSQAAGSGRPCPWRRVT